MEIIREVKISVYVDTNKVTYEKEFDSIEAAKEYLETIKENIQQ